MVAVGVTSKETRKLPEMQGGKKRQEEGGEEEGLLHWIIKPKRHALLT